MATLTVRAKLTIAFIGLSLAVVLVSALALKTLAEANSRFESYVNGVNARATTAHQVREAVDARAIAARNIILVTKAEDLEVEKASVFAAHADVGKYLARLKALSQQEGTAAKARELIAEIDRVESLYGPVALSIVDMGIKRQNEQAIVKINDECRPLLAALVKASVAYNDYTKANIAQEIEAAQAIYTSQRAYLLITCVVVALLAAAAGVYITKSITKPISEAVTFAEAVASGDLTSSIRIQRADEIGRLLAAMQNMQNSLVRVVADVRDGSEAVATASSEIAQGNHDLSARTERQASALQQTAASMEQLGTTVRQNAQSAIEASRLAKDSSSIAINGGKVVNLVVDTMRGINESSNRIAEIISVIDGIAFQTNILALNAAVEAARAGEQGRGFAVVASEVRSLAGRSADAAKEIKTLITESVARVQDGTALVDQAGATMNEVVASIQKVSDIVAQISAASMEQSQGVGQVGQAVTQMDQATQQNAALVEEMAAAASSLKVQAKELVNGVAVFRLGAQASAGSGLLLLQ